ncbi:hypothetical protein [Luteipulveratus mongoliensis]|uniref:Integral membrane protein n=1 Tax=Luteipulveratus mongoliensis TaxID=571913 RepID=A0A0K1JET4_9MICO|nr:hypothetical protein [Luteipulveratus mongoliensis]AKU15120.1 hypothetical protein VV02_03325 [Luteipulveratus mongoliensis]
MAGHWVELRIHGVSGAPPEDLLESAHTKQVAGDSSGRFFRPTDTLGQELQKPGRILEGYHWGRFTSGSWRQGLWLILVPFGFVNAAAFMVPHPGDRRPERVWHTIVGALIRALGICLTCIFGLSIGLILVDLLAWQWAAGLDTFKGVRTGLLMSAGLVVGALVLLGLHQLGNQHRMRRAPEDAPGSIAESTTVGLCRRAFYAGDPDAPTLGRLHLAAGWTEVAIIGSLTAQRVSSSGFPDALFVAGLIVLILIAAATTLLGDPSGSVTGTQRHEMWHDQVMRPVSVAALLSSVGLIACSVGALAGTDGHALTLDFDRYSSWLAAVVGVGVLALLIANAILAWLTRNQEDADPRPFRRYAGGMAPWAAASTGVFIGVGFCGAFVLGTARLVGANAQTALIYRTTYAWGLTVLLLATMVVVGLLFTIAKRTALVREVEASYDVLRPDAVLPRRWILRIALACGVSRVKNTIPVVFLTTAIGGMLITVVTTVEMFDVNLPTVFGWLSAVPSDGPSARVVTSLGTYALTGLAAVLLVLGRRSLRTEQTRRGVNVVWDVVSFWPHSAHPFVPPAYSQFAVRELRNRIRFHLGLLDVQPPEGPADRVVVAAHSQGSLIAFASTMWLGEEESRRVGLLTFGSQLQVAFPRAFPGYVNHGLIEQVHQQLDGRWINLYRETDPIAGPVLSWDRTSMAQGDPHSTSVGVGEGEDRIDERTGRRESGDDWRLLDPTPYDPELQLGAVDRMGRHSGFIDCPDYAEAIELVRRPR